MKANTIGNTALMKQDTPHIRWPKRECMSFVKRFDFKRKKVHFLIRTSKISLSLIFLIC